MKKISTFMFAAGLVIAMGCLPAMAQMLHVSFTAKSSFYAGNAKMPAGSYSLQQAPDESTFYILQNTAGTHSVYVEARASAKASKGGPEVLFNKYGDMDYLEGIETSNQTSVDFLEGIPEKIAAKKGAPVSHTVPAK